MPASNDIALVRRLYGSAMAPEVAGEIMAPNLVFGVTPGFPNGRVYRGWESVGRDFFGPFMPEYDSLAAVAEAFYADEDGHVFVYGPRRPEGR